MDWYDIVIVVLVVAGAILAARAYRGWGHDL